MTVTHISKSSSNFSKAHNCNNFLHSHPRKETLPVLGGGGVSIHKAAVEVSMYSNKLPNTLTVCIFPVLCASVFYLGQ